MSYELEIQKSLPVTFDSLNGGRPPLVAGSGSATLLTASTTHTGFAGWVKGREASPFSIELWALPVTVTSTLLLVGHVAEGLFYDGTDYILRIELATGVLEGRWTEPEKKAHHFVMIYDTSEFSLYVDGQRVITIDVPPDSAFPRVAPQLNLNHSGGSVIYDSLATYYRTLSMNEIKEHFALGRSVGSSVSIASSKGASTWSLTYADVDVFQTISFAGDDWSRGYFTDVSYTADRLEPDEDGGTWQVAIPLGSMVSPTTPGVHLRYVGQGVTLEWSTDAVEWQAINNKTTILEDADATELTLFIRLTLIDGDSWVQSLAADLLGSRAMQPFSSNRQLLFKNAEMDQTPGSQLEYQDDRGAQMRAGSLEITVDPSLEDPRPISTIEMWAKLDDNDGFLIGATASNYVRINAGVPATTGFTAYRNGVALPAGSLSVGEWDHYVFVSTSPLTGLVRIGDKLGQGEHLDVTIGHLAVYEKAMTASDVASLYQANIGAPGLRVDDAGGFSLSESATPYDIYAYTWSIVGGSS